MVTRTALGLVFTLACMLGALWILVRLLEPRAAFFPSRGEQVTPAAMGVAFEALDVRTGDGETLRAWRLARARPLAEVVYFHGNGGNLGLWSPVFVELHRRGYGVFAFDYRGYGASTGSPSERGLYRDVDAVLEVVARQPAAAGVPLVYWGRSLGATMAAYGASRHAPNGVVLEAGFPDTRTLLAGNPVLSVLSHFSSYRFPTATWMATVTSPTLVLHGTADSVIPYPMGERLYEALRGPKRFHAIVGGDHNDPEPRDAETYWRVVQEFVRGLSG
jgi:fermentation-respiration switch protein FrsA (DUF1100 family)